MKYCPNCGEPSTVCNWIDRSKKCVTQELGATKLKLAWLTEALEKYSRVRGKSNRSKREAKAWDEVEELLNGLH